MLLLVLFFLAAANSIPWFFSWPFFPSLLPAVYIYITHIMRIRIGVWISLSLNKITKKKKKTWKVRSIILFLCVSEPVFLCSLHFILCLNFLIKNIQKIENRKLTKLIKNYYYYISRKILEEANRNTNNIFFVRPFPFEKILGKALKHRIITTTIQTA